MKSTVAYASGLHIFWHVLCTKRVTHGVHTSYLGHQKKKKKKKNLAKRYLAKKKYTLRTARSVPVRISDRGGPRFENVILPVRVTMVDLTRYGQSDQSGRSRTTMYGRPGPSHINVRNQIKWSYDHESWYMTHFAQHKIKMHGATTKILSGTGAVVPFY